MTIFLAIILGVVEGLTEFFPVSSTGHLIFLSEIFNIPQTDTLKLFQVFIQFGAVLAILVLYWKDILKEKKIISSANFMKIDYVNAVFLAEHSTKTMLCSYANLSLLGLL